mmetsp:Transcript_2975/g.5509  ORF Transcript_2975/g.5509 Transcript_2975/m.5509 type:complete len:223 (-) Transcript_2975:390-1058(-)
MLRPSRPPPRRPRPNPGLERLLRVCRVWTIVSVTIQGYQTIEGVEALGVAWLSLWLRRLLVFLVGQSLAVEKHREGVAQAPLVSDVAAALGVGQFLVERVHHVKLVLRGVGAVGLHDRLVRVLNHVRQIQGSDAQLLCQLRQLHHRDDLPAAVAAAIATVAPAPLAAREDVLGRGRHPRGPAAALHRRVDGGTHFVVGAGRVGREPSGSRPMPGSRSRSRVS